jgi:hypothetical protein
LPSPKQKTVNPPGKLDSIRETRWLVAYQAEGRFEALLFFPLLIGIKFGVVMNQSRDGGGLNSGR